MITSLGCYSSILFHKHIFVCIYSSTNCWKIACNSSIPNFGESCAISYLESRLIGSHKVQIKFFVHWVRPPFSSDYDRIHVTGVPQYVDQWWETSRLTLATLKTNQALVFHGRKYIYLLTVCVRVHCLHTRHLYIRYHKWLQIYSIGKNNSSKFWLLASFLHALVAKASTDFFLSLN